MKNILKHSNKIIAVLLCAVLLASYSSNFATEKIETLISGISKSVSAFSSKELNKTIQIYPSDEKREVFLQLYNSKDKKYNTVKTYQTAITSGKAKLTLNFPKSKRKRTYGKWRIYVKEGKKAKSASKIINLYSKNIVKKDVSAKAVCIYCVDSGKTIYSKKSKKQLPQASITKVMTATLLIESSKLSKSTKISEKAAKTPYSHPKMVKGDSYKNKALLHAMLIPSSNGAAVAVSESVSKTTKNFIKEMNKKAEKLGLENTHYNSVHGLDTNNHYSCAYDTARLTGYIYSKSDDFRSVIAKSKYTIKSKQGRKETLKSTDELKGYSKNHKGGKTGYTSGAGYCFTGVYVYKGITYVACILGSESNKTRWSDMKKLYKYIDDFAQTKY